MDVTIHCPKILCWTPCLGSSVAGRSHSSSTARASGFLKRLHFIFHYMKSSCFLLVQCTHTHTEQHFAHTLPAFLKSLKKSFQCVLARDRVPAGLQHQTLDFMMQTRWSRQPAFRLTKKGFCWHLLWGLHGTLAFFGPMKTGLQLAVTERKKNSLTNVVPWKCSSLQKDKKESGSCGCPSWGVQQEQASSGYAASWPGMMAKHWGSARSWLSQDWRGAGKDVRDLAQRQDGCGSGSLAQSPVVICWGWGKRSPMSAQLLSELLSVCLSSQHSSAWEEGEELLFDRISFVLFCNPSNRMETDNVQFVLIQLYLVSPSYNTAANIILKNRDVMEEGEILQTLLITSQVITINIWRREKLLI